MTSEFRYFFYNKATGIFVLILFILDYILDILINNKKNYFYILELYFLIIKNPCFFNAIIDYISYY